MAPADGSASVYHCALQSRDHEPYALATVGSRTERTKRRFKAPPGESGARRDTASRHQQGRAGGPGGSAPLPGPPLPRKGSPAEAGLKDLCLKPQGGNVGVRHNVSTLHDSPRAAIRPRFRGASPGRRQPARVRSQDRTCRIGSDAGGCVFNVAQEKTDEGGTGSPDGVSVGGMGGGTPIQPPGITRARARCSVPVSRICVSNLERRRPFACGGHLEGKGGARGRVLLDRLPL